MTDKNEDKNQYLPAFARDVIAGQHSSIAGTVGGKKYEVIFAPEDATHCLRIVTEAPEIVAQVLLRLSDAITAESAK